MTQEKETVLFPEFVKFVVEAGLMNAPKGGLAAKLPRILGQGMTRTVGMEAPPAPIERKQELATLELPPGVHVPEPVRAEIERVRTELKAELDQLSTMEGSRQFFAQVMNGVPAPKDFKDNRYVSAGLVLKKDEKQPRFSWGITIHHPIISKIPADVLYVIRAHQEAVKLLKALEQPTERFSEQFDLAWDMARHFSESDSVLVSDVARLYRVARQSEKFWNNPERKYFVDMPAAAFIAGLRAWQRVGGPASRGYEFVPATLTQEPRSFYLPANEEGTLAKPYVYIQKRK